MKPDLLIVGAGAAGVSAALWAHSLDLSVRVIEAGEQPGGQLHRVHFEPRNFAASQPGEGRVLAERMRAQLEAAAIEVRYGVSAAALEPARPGVRTATGESLAASAVIVATGARPRKLEVPGARELEGRGVSDSATRDRAGFAGEDVAVVGGGDAAFENALLLADVGCKVTLLVRDTPNARPVFRERVARVPRIEVLEHANVTDVRGDGRVSGVRVESERGSFELPIAALVVKIGIEPNSEWLAGALDRDPEGYVLVDERLGTSQARVWAAGDITRPAVPGVALALGHGATAVAAIIEALRGS